MNLPQYIRRKVYNLTHPMQGSILMLHRVVEQCSEDPNQRELEVTPDFLEHTILDYLQNGYTFVPIDSIFNAHRFVCLTFDDGYRDNYTTALPILKRLGIPFAIYISTNFIDNKQPMWWYPDQQLGLSLEELRTLDREPLCTIGAHTLSHPRLDTLTVIEQQKEIVESKVILEQWLGHPIQHFSYPHGAYNDDTLSIVKSAGFRSALCAWGGTVRRGYNPHLLNRIELRQQ